MGNAAELRSDGEKILRNVDGTIKAGSELVSEMKEGLDQIGQAVKKTGSMAAQQMSDVAEKAYSKVLDTSRKGAEQLEAEIKEYPFTTVLTAFGLGAFFGMLLRR